MYGVLQCRGSVLHCPACVYGYNTFNNSVFAVSCCLLDSLVLLWCLIIGWKWSLLELIGSSAVLSGRSSMGQRSYCKTSVWPDVILSLKVEQHVKVMFGMWGMNECIRDVWTLMFAYLFWYVYDAHYRSEWQCWEVNVNELDDMFVKVAMHVIFYYILNEYSYIITYLLNYSHRNDLSLDTCSYLLRIGDM